MKPAGSTLATLLMVSLWASTPLSAHGQNGFKCRGETRREILINKFSMAPREATGEVEYCRGEPGEFRARVVLRNMQANAGYLLTLNGIPGQPGNDSLGRKCDRRGPEGYCDFRTVTTDAQGQASEVVSVALEPGEYAAKFFVKNLDREPRYQIVLLSDNPKFSVLPTRGPVVEIFSPRPDTQVGPSELVKGRVSEPGLFVYVLVHPLLGQSWWVQRLPTPPNRDGSWQSIAYFGTDTGKGIGEHFEVVVIAARNRTLLTEGQTISGQRVRQLMEEHIHSDVVAVKRVR